MYLLFGGQLFYCVSRWLWEQTKAATVERRAEGDSGDVQPDIFVVHSSRVWKLSEFKASQSDSNVVYWSWRPRQQHHPLTLDRWWDGLEAQRFFRLGTSQTRFSHKGGNESGINSCFGGRSFLFISASNISEIWKCCSVCTINQNPGPAWC